MKQGDAVAAQSWLEKAQETVNRPPPAGVIGTARRDKAEAIFTATSIEIKLAQPDNKAVLAKAVKEAEAAHQKFPLSRGIAHQYGEACWRPASWSRPSTCATRRSCTARYRGLRSAGASVCQAGQAGLAAHCAGRIVCAAGRHCRRWTSWRWRARRPMPRSTTSR
jgi:hypothetical protein